MPRASRTGAPPDLPRFGSHTVAIGETTIAPGVELAVLARPERLDSSTVVLRRGIATAGSSQDWISRQEENTTTTDGMAPKWIRRGLVLSLLGAALLWALTGWPPSGC